jgi:UDP-N-acetylmuramate--alanine ligase
MNAIAPEQVSAATERLRALGPVHIVGIGGAGMSGIARILLARGVTVSGSDAKDSRRLANLRSLGATIHIGHAGGHLGEGPSAARTVVASTAIADTNVELAEARRRNLIVMSRADALVAVMSGHHGVAVAGTHGKTTTTSMLTVALQHAGADPSFAIGSELNETGSNAHLGTGELFVVEADESDGTFLRLEVDVAVVTNVEPDHLDYWKTFDAIEAGFEEFARAIGRRNGVLVVCIDDDGAARLARSARASDVDVRTYGERDDADFRIINIVTNSAALTVPAHWSFEVVHDHGRVGPIRLAVPGTHNILNATGALTTGIALGFDPESLKAGLESFTGTRRRFDFRGSAAGVRVYDDYAHHPTEIAATLTAARRVVGEGRLIVAFQAHHYYRTAMFTREFGAALGLADEVVVLEVFAPGEEPIPGASGQTMAANVPLPREHVLFEPSWSAVAGALAGRARTGDIVMTLGAGDISMIGPEVLDLLRERDQSQGGTS